VAIRRAIGSLQGPPCESWTIARFAEFEQDLKAPQPLRLASLSERHLKQVHLANVLLQVAHTFYLALVASGGFSVTEHPAEAKWHPRQDIAPSIWKLDETKLLAGADSSEILTFNQSIHGSVGSKPTSLLCLRLPTLRYYVRRAQCDFVPCVRRPGGLIGRADDGSWRTAPAKEYPPSLCRAIARAMVALAMVVPHDPYAPVET
ncbi:unnamed protein product, partial [Polarella glacialis]